MKLWEVHKVKVEEIGKSNVTCIEQQKVNLSELEAQELTKLMNRDTIGFKYVKICNPMGSLMSNLDKQQLIEKELSKGG